MAKGVGEADHYRRREEDERHLADLATSRAIRTHHLNMADRYREKAQLAQLRQTGQDRERPPSNDTTAS